jgi:selenocysteine-specific elongation factor
MMRRLVIGMAGHVDHGKTTLVRALTGTDTDRLAEEQARGMTIDLGFAFLTLPDGTEAGIVDVPGHERFVKNMLAGAGGIDLALLVIAADEGPMPQTYEHLDVLTVLGVRCGVVALTRSDLADPELAELVRDDTRAALRKTPLADAPIVSVSAASGEGLDALRDALALAARAVPARDSSAPFRLPVDRAFRLPGIGTVVTGTLVAGTMKTGDSVVVLPQGRTSRARSLQTHGATIEQAQAGSRVAVNLPGIDVTTLERGAVVAPPGTLTPSSLLDILLTLLPSARRPLKDRERVRVHLGTGEVLARVALLGAERALEPGSADVPAQLLCEEQTVAARGERLVIRAYSPARVIGGGIVVDPKPAGRHRRGDAAAQALAIPDSLTEQVYAALAERPADQAVAELVARIGGEDPAVTAALDRLVEQGRAARLDDGRWISDRAAQRLTDTARRTLTVFHRQNPLRRAMPTEGLRTPLAKAATVREFGGVLVWLIQRGVVVDEGVHGVRLPEHAVVLPPAWQAAAAHILAVYDGAGFSPPDPADFAATLPRDIHVPSLLNVLCEEGTLVRIGDRLYLSARALETAKQAIRTLATGGREITVGEVRDALGSSRKIVLPLLEHLDTLRFTHRSGDTRTLPAESR